MKAILNFWVGLFLVVLLLPGPAAMRAEAKTIFINIGTGEVTGIYYPTGVALAKIINKQRKKFGIRATVEPSGGSTYNINGVMAGDLEFGIVQSDRQFQAVQGEADWAAAGPQKGLRAVFSIHPEVVTLVASVDSGIIAFSDLRGKRVNIGNPGSGPHKNAIDALAANGLSWETDMLSVQTAARKASALLQNRRIDAFFYTAGHPSDIFRNATSGATKVRFIEIPKVDSLAAEFPYYAPADVPVALYPGADNKENVNTFGVKATLVTSNMLPDEVVYTVTREIFENFDDFKKLQPAYAGLSKKSMLEGLSAPIHPGALKYYREAGLK